MKRTTQESKTAFKLIKYHKPNAANLYPLQIRYRENKLTRFAKVNFYIEFSAWDAEKNQLSKDYKDYDKVMELYYNGINEIKNKKEENESMLSYIQKHIELLEYDGKYGNARKFQGFLTKLKDYDHSLSRHGFEVVTKDYIKGFQMNMARTGYKVKKEVKRYSFFTINSGLDTLRSICNKAIEDKIYEPENHLILSRLPKLTTQKKLKGLTQQEFIKFLNYTPEKELERKAKNIWLYQFYCAGIRISDVIMLRYRNLKYVDGKLIMSFVTYKTKRHFEMELNETAIELIEQYKYSSKPLSELIIHDHEEFVFKLMKHGLEPKKRYTYMDSIRISINNQLGKISSKLKLSIKLTTHTARHSFSQIALVNDVDVYTISKALNHSSLKVTESYLKQFDHEYVSDKLKIFFNKVG